jgi:GxxExxY protein
MVFKHREVTEQIIGAFRHVYNRLGSGFSERVYHAAIIVEMRGRGLCVASEQPIEVYYRGVVVGQFFADLLVNGCVLVELKAVDALTDEHRAQPLNYLKATHYEVGLLLNFGDAPQVERKAYDNVGKGSLSWAMHDQN